MTSPITDKHSQLQSGISSLYNNHNDSVMSSFSCSTPANLSFAHCNNNIISTSNESSNLITLSMINQALNLNIDRQPNSSLQFPEIQKMCDNKVSNGISPALVSEYHRIKQAIDNSGLLSPNENLVTKNRGECYWSNCYFQSDIEEIFKKHLTDCHQLTSATLAQLDISLERSRQLSNMLLNEQNHMYNMMLHLDQKFKSLPGEASSLSDFHYLSMLLNKFKQTPALFDCVSDSARLGTEIPSLHVSQQLPHYSTNHLAPLHQQSPTINKSNFSQQLIDNLSSALLRQQALPIPSQNSNYQQPLFSTSHITQPTFSFSGNIVVPAPKPEIMNSNLNNGTIAVPSGTPNPNLQLTNIDSNLKDVLSQARSSDSNYARSDSEVSPHIKDKKIKGLRRATIDEPGQQLTNNMTDREYYRQFAVRPSASYVNLIKTAILESARRELSLNEIYVWMQTEFAYFRDKEQKWKNAIRHNLSLHKCFQRKHGKLWTFNENEYNIKKSRNRFQYNVPVTGSEVLNADGDCYDDYDGPTMDCYDDGPNEDNENPEGHVKKEMKYNDENVPDEMVLDTDEWSKYLHKNSIKSTSSTVDISMLPNLRTDRCPTIDN